MKKQFLQRLLRQHIFLDILALIVLSLIVLFFNIPVGLLCIVLIGGVWFVHQRWASTTTAAALEEFELKIRSEGGEVYEALTQSDVQALCIVDKSGKISWNNKKFTELFSDRQNVTEFISKDAFEELCTMTGGHTPVDYEDRKYFVSPSAIPSTDKKALLVFKDVTYSERIKQLYQDTRSCLAIVNVDNYDDMLANTPLENQSAVVAEIDKEIRTYFGEISASVTRFKAGSYLILFETKHLESLRKSNFEILNKFHEIETGADFPTTVSIGVSYEAQNPEQLQANALEAAELALGRGGDQAVLISPNAPTEFFGGQSAAVEKRNKGKSRTIAHALVHQIKAAEKVFVMGHRRPDMDSLGSAIGIFALAGKFGKSAKIVLDEAGEAIEQLYNASLEKGGAEYITGKDALAALTEDTLLVIVDCHRAEMTECPQLAQKASKIVIIDHHRRSQGAITNAVLSYTEVAASSASELITEIIQYSEDRADMNRFTAEALLAGITLDTKNFTSTTGARTYEAASFLKRNGADGNNVKAYFKQRLEFVQKKFNLIASTEVLGDGYAIAYTKEEDPAMQVLVSQAADELLEMRGIKAVFAAGKIGDRTTISARSSGDVNVQIIMEKLGGGGHQNASAAQLDMSPEEAMNLLVNKLREEKYI